MYNFYLIEEHGINFPLTAEMYPFSKKTHYIVQLNFFQEHMISIELPENPRLMKNFLIKGKPFDAEFSFAPPG